MCNPRWAEQINEGRNAQFSIKTLALGARAITATGFGWTLDAANSQIAFGSVKSNMFGEVHTFNGLSGAVDRNGAAQIEIDRDRNEYRHITHDRTCSSWTRNWTWTPSLILRLATQLIEVEGALSFLGIENRRTLRRTLIRDAGAGFDRRSFIDVDDFGMTAGVDVLKDLAGLDSITRAAPGAFDVRRQSAARGRKR